MKKQTTKYLEIYDIAVSGLTKEGRDFAKSGGEIIIPEGIEIICNNAFNGTFLKHVKLPSTLEIIGESAFRGTEIEEIVIPKMTEDIGDFAFQNSKLQKVTLEKGSKLKVLRRCAMDTGYLKELNLEEATSLMGLKSRALVFNKLKHLKIKTDEDLYIGLQAGYSSDILDVDIESKGDITISVMGFNQNEKLKNVRIKGKKIYLEENSFAYSDIENLEIEGEEVIILNGAFFSNRIKSPKIKNLTFCDLSAFSENPIENLDIPDEIKNKEA